MDSRCSEAQSPEISLRCCNRWISHQKCCFLGRTSLEIVVHCWIKFIGTYQETPLKVYIATPSSKLQSSINNILLHAYIFYNVIPQFYFWWHFLLSRIYISYIRPLLNTPLPYVPSSNYLNDSISNQCKEHTLSASPSVFGFSLDTWSLWILDSGFAQTSGHALIITPSSLTSLSIFGRFASSALVFLTNRFYSALAWPLILGRLPEYQDTRAPALFWLLWLHFIASSTDYQTLGSRHRYLGVIGSLWERYSVMPLLVRTNQPQEK